jgi:uncharacterized protein YjiS (DUF1127 family)
MQATATPLPSAQSHAFEKPAMARTPHAAGVDVSRPSANAPEIDMAVAEKRSPLARVIARVIALWEAQAAAFRPVALDVGPWLPSEVARHAAAVGTGSIVSAAVHGIAGRIAAAWKARQQRRAAMRDIEILRQLDDATLRDIGVLRDDIAPAAYENARRRAGG